jgi:hypothetical protein
MISSSFYNDNLFRSYPFKYDEGDTDTQILNQTIVGIKIMVYAGSSFTNSFPLAYLVNWVSLLDNYKLTFQIRDKTGITVNKQIIIPTETAPFTKIVSDDKDDVIVSIVTGKIPTITRDWLNINKQIEPTCLLWYRHRGISNIYVANQDRHRLKLDPEMIDSEYKNIYGTVNWWIQPEAGLLSISDGDPCLFDAGFNCEINRANITQEIRFIPREKEGLGAVSEDIALGYTVIDTGHIVEASPSSNLRKDGIPGHGNVVSYFCSAPGPDIVLTTETAVLVRSDLPSSTIFISVATLFGESC